MDKQAKALMVKGVCNFGGIEIINFSYGIVDRVTSCEDYGDGRVNFSTSKIYSNKKGETYFMRYGRRQYLKDYTAI